MIERVYLDVHGTVADFVGAWCALTGRAMPERWPAGVWSLEEVFEASTSEIWDPIARAGASWWASLPPTPEAASILALARSISDSVVFATSPASPGSDRCAEAAGSTRLILDRYGDSPRILASKSELAKPGRLLIDDSPAQVDAWRQAGGVALLVPRPWNGRGLGPAETIADLRRQLAALDTVAGGVFCVEVPVPAEILRPNGRTTNHRARSAAVKRYRLACGVLALGAIRRQRIEPPAWVRVTIEPRFRTMGPKWDDGNAIAALKAAEDALQDAGILKNDRGVRWVSPTFERVKTTRETGVELIVRRTG